MPLRSLGRTLAVEEGLEVLDELVLIFELGIIRQLADHAGAEFVVEARNANEAPLPDALLLSGAILEVGSKRMPRITIARQRGQSRELG